VYTICVRQSPVSCIPFLFFDRGGHVSDKSHQEKNPLFSDSTLSPSHRFKNTKILDITNNKYTLCIHTIRIKMKAIYLPHAEDMTLRARSDVYPRKLYKKHQKTNSMAIGYRKNDYKEEKPYTQILAEDYPKNLFFLLPVVKTQYQQAPDGKSQYTEPQDIYYGDNLTRGTVLPIRDKETGEVEPMVLTSHRHCRPDKLIGLDEFLYEQRVEARGQVNHGKLKVVRVQARNILQNKNHIAPPSPRSRYHNPMYHADNIAKGNVTYHSHPLVDRCLQEMRDAHPTQPETEYELQRGTYHPNMSYRVPEPNNSKIPKINDIRNCAQIVFLPRTKRGEVQLRFFTASNEGKQYLIKREYCKYVHKELPTPPPEFQRGSYNEQKEIIKNTEE